MLGSRGQSSIAMTKLSIEKLTLRPGTKESYIYDRDFSRLALRVRRSADGGYSHAWVYCYMLHGKRKKRYIGSYPKVPIREAHEQARQYEQEIDRGDDPVQLVLERREHSKPRTFGELYERWFEESIKLIRPKSYTHVAQIFRDHVFYSTHIKDTSLSNISRGLLLNIIAKIKKKGIDRTLEMSVQLLKQLFSWAELVEYMERDPARRLKEEEFVHIESRSRYLDKKEIFKLIQGLNKAKVESQFIHAIMLILATGNRSTETRLIKISDVNLQEKTITIPAENQKKVPKTERKTHVVHLSDFALKHVNGLINLAGPSKYLIPHLRYSKDRFLKPISKCILMLQLARHDGVSAQHQSNHLHFEAGKFTIHDLRRTASTHMQSLGVLYDVIDKCQNHKIKGEVRRTYLRSEMRPQMIDAWNKLGAFLQEIEDAALEDCDK